MPQLSGVSHVAFTVTDLDRSRAWYADVLDWQLLMEGEDKGIRYVVGVLPDANVILGLRQHEGGTGDEFHPGRTGLDHVAFSVTSRAALDEWKAAFDEKGVRYSDIQDVPYGHCLNFKDPDNIALEIFAVPGS
ncbi:MAG: glyoxylase family protein [Actinomycetota bacterium]|jgi:catechol 2,3-dioxygenase-like lactoylglutathione lyase family enzyme|nr:glyoxylase family protein [Actinomycetota bacterium]